MQNELLNARRPLTLYVMSEPPNRKSDNDRTTEVRFNVTEAEKEAMDLTWRARGAESLADWIRRLALTEVRRISRETD